MKNIIGIDGGGTKTEFLLCDETGSVIKRILKASGNPVDVGIDIVCKMLNDGICELLNVNDSKNVVIDGMFVGLSGGSVSDNATKVHTYIEKNFPHAKFQNGSDAMNVISAGLGDEDGVILIAGTGSVAFARCGKTLNRAGGWGYLFDGAGGGYELGQKAIQACLKEIDGTGEKTYLSHLIERELGMDAGKALTKFYDGGKRYIASFAPLVFEAFRENDAVAKNIIEDTISYWVTIIKRAMMYCPHSNKVALAGSLFKQKEIFLPIMSEKIKSEFILTDIPPVFGAIREAFKISGISVDEKIITTYKETYERACQNG